MVSKEFKELVKGIKKAGWTVWDIPGHIALDKITLEPKPTTKNMTAYELVQLVGELSDKELEVFHFRNRRKEIPLRGVMAQYVQSQLNENLGIIERIIELYKTYTDKIKDVKIKRDREAKKREKELVKQKLIMSLDRKDIANTISNIKKSMEPHIIRQEKFIEDVFKKKEKQLMDDWNTIYKELQNTGIVKDSFYSGTRSPESLLMYGRIKYNDTTIKIKEYIRINHYLFIHQWFDKKGYALKPSAKFILDGQTDDLIERAQTQFRQNEELKVEILFHRLMKNNPTLRKYELAVPYNGSEFTLSAENEKGEELLIQTNTIEAGGYNIQRLHTRWLVGIRNTVTNKKEKFTIDDRDVKKG